MRVNNVHLTYVPVAQPEARQAADAHQAEGVASTTPNQASTHVPSAQLAGLLDQVRQTPAVRPDRLREVAERLASGYYLTPEAAQQTADAIQNSPD
ncbi:MAG: hypothetical protein IT429_12455 [Gemmataceae bacterium]|nr:hypothetical protein [Gemmataceae bacterium]